MRVIPVLYLCTNQMSRLFEAAVLTASYAKFRPQPPPSVVSRVINYVKERLSAQHLNVAVDVGCGSGQVYITKRNSLKC